MCVVDRASITQVLSENPMLRPLQRQEEGKAGLGDSEGHATSLHMDSLSVFRAGTCVRGFQLIAPRCGRAFSLQFVVFSRYLCLYSGIGAAM
jgi:hypothetical protein